MRHGLQEWQSNLYLSRWYRFHGCGMILDIIVFTLIPVLLYRLLFLNPEKYLDMECNINKTAGKWLVCAFMLLYPFSDMVSAGWIATTVNYLWPLLGLLYIALLLQKLAQKGHVHWYEGAGGVVSCIFCSSQEQVAAILLVLLFLAMVYSWRRKKSGSLWIYGYAVIDVISLFTILRCPGNGIRSMQEVEGRMPEFAYFSVLEKIYMGAANIERIFVAAGQQYFPDRLGRACRIGRTENKKFDKNAAVICSGILYPWICTDPHRASVV